MTKDEALKLALEAMTYADACLKKQLTMKYKHEYAQDLLLEAGTAIKEALAQPEPCGGCKGSGWVTRDPDIGTDQECFVCGGSGAYPKEQEPVAWNVIDPTGKIVATEMNSVRGWARIEGYKPTVEGLLGFHEQGWRVVPTTPPQRTWVGLTDKDKASFWTADQMTGEEWRRLFAEVEAKLKEKNT